MDKTMFRIDQSIKQLFIFLLLFSFFQCKKTEKNDQLLKSQPSIITTVATVYGTGKGHKTADNPDVYEYHYQTRFRVGDTLELVGRLFPETVRIQVGKTEAKIVLQKKVTVQASGPGIPSVEADYVKFLITKEMGIGPEIPIFLTVNGQQMNAPSIQILETAVFDGRSDPTLAVDSLFSLLQPEFGMYETDYILGGNVSGNGKVCVYNKLAVYAVPAAKLSPVKLVQTGITYGEPGDEFKFNVIKYAAYSWDGTEVYISGEVTDSKPNNPDVGVKPKARPFGVSRFLKINVQTKRITMLNRSFFGRNLRKGGFDAPPLKPVSGKLEDVSLVVDMIKVDAYDGLYLTNTITVSLGNDVEIVSKCNNGMVHTLFSTDSTFPGKYAANGAGMQFNPVSLLGYAGVMGYQISNPSYFSFKTEEPLVTYITTAQNDTHFYSDTSKITGNTPFIKSSVADLQYSTVMKPQYSAVLQSGEIVLMSGYSNSVSSYNLNKKVSYTYAGAEKDGGAEGFKGHRSGLAKYVDFRTGTVWNMTILGVDEKNNIYFHRHASQLAASNLPDSYAKVYKLHKP